jgi:hypothetical protein
LSEEGKPMAHDNAKRLLANAGTFDQRQKAILEAIQLGMPLIQIEEYLDWLDNSDRPKRACARPEPADVRVDKEPETPRRHGRLQKWRRAFLADPR